MTIADERAAGTGTAHGVWALLRKDLQVFDARDAAIVLGAYLLLAAQIGRWDEGAFWLGVALAGALVVAVPFAEWLFDAERLLGSLPVRRATVVLARYAAALAGCGAAAVVWIASGRLLAPLLAPHRTGPAMWDTLEGVLAFLVVATGLVAIFLPLYFRLALGRAALAFGPVCLVLLAVSSAVVPASGAAAPAGVPLSPPSEIIHLGVEALVARAGPVPAVVLTVAGLGAMLAVSGWLSLRGFERRDL